MRELHTRHLLLVRKHFFGRADVVSCCFLLLFLCVDVFDSMKSSVSKEHVGKLKYCKKDMVRHLLSKLHMC